MGPSKVLCPALIAVVAMSCAPRTTATTAPTPAPAPAAGAPAPGQAAPPAAAPAAGPKPYNRVITAAAKTRRGLFSTHRVNEKLFFEIPARELGRDLLLTGRLARSAGGEQRQEYGGDMFAERVVRWERTGNKVYLRSPIYAITADSTSAVYQAVLNSNYPPIVAVFDVESYGPDSAVVIDVTKLYTTAVVEFQAVRGIIDPARSYVERVAAFPDNIEIEATQTAMPTPGTAATIQFSGYGGSSTQGARSVLAHWSMIRLPEKPMMPRLFDDRVGYFSSQQVDFGTPEHRSVRKTYITRYRLEKKDPNAALSEPVKPITYYVDPATPPQWVRWVKAGIEEWQPAFEEAGFKNGIVAKMPPSASEDPDWSAEDIRYTVVRWLSSPVENAVGPHIHDPRTGEILNGSVKMFHNVMNLLRFWYWVQVAAVDPRIQTLPMPDTLMGRLVQYVVAHEVGHTLGFQHNMKASATYPADSVRSPSFVARMGHTPTLMDYSRFNYVAQPEDKIALGDLVPKVGPYDKFATMWGYKPIPGARTPEDEKATLDRWASMQDTVPWFRFSTSGARGSDYGDQSEAVGDADAVKSTALGLKNIKRMVPMVVPATVRAGESNADLIEMYDRLIGQWGLEMGHVANIIGSSSSQEKYGSQKGARFTPVSRARQAEAVAFLNENVFKTPMYLVDKDAMRRMEPEGTLARIAQRQGSVISALFNNGRMGRLLENEAMSSSRDAYTLGDLIGDVRKGVWTELSAGSVKIDAYRRNLQHAYLDEMRKKVDPAEWPTPPANAPREFAAFFAPPPADAVSQLRGSLLDLDRQVAGAVSRASDQETRYHLLGVRDKIDKMLNPAPKARAAR